MSRDERNAYFERLVTLKLRPAGDDDRRSVISIEDAIVYAEAVMLATELELEAAEADDAAAAEAAATLATAMPEAEPAPSPSDHRSRSRRLMDGWFGPSRGSRPELGGDDRI